MFAPRAGAQLPRAAPAASSASTREEFARPRPRAPRRRGEPVLHDRARAAHRPRFAQRRQPAARRGLAADVARALARRCPIDEMPIAHITNGVHTRTWTRARDARAARPLPRPGLARATRRPHGLGSAPTRSPTRSCGARTSGAASASCRSRASACASSSRRGARAASQSRLPTRCSTRTRSPSASRAASPPTSAPTLLFRDPERLARLLNDPDAAGAAHLRRQGAPAGRARQGAHPRRSSSQLAAPELARPRRLPRGLRHATWRALPGAGRRRLAQHAAPAARGERHQRHEGRRQRRAQPVGPRRLVGRGLRRAESGLGRSAAARSTTTRSSRTRVEAEALYDLLEHEVVPLFYERDASGCRASGSAMKNASIGVSCAEFNTGTHGARVRRARLPPRAPRAVALDARRRARARASSPPWRERMRAAWPGVGGPHRVGTTARWWSGRTLKVERSSRWARCADDVRVEVVPACPTATGPAVRSDRAGRPPGPAGASSASWRPSPPRERPPGVRGARRAAAARRRGPEPAS